MTRLTQRLADAFGEAYKQAHPEETDPPPSAEEIEQSGIDALRQAMYGRRQPPTTTQEENHDQ